MAIKEAKEITRLSNADTGPVTATVTDSLFFRYDIEDTSDLENLLLLLNISNRKHLQVYVHKIKQIASSRVTKAANGTIISLDPLIVSAKYGSLEVITVSEGTKDAPVMSGAQFVKRHQLEVGSRLNASNYSSGR